MRRFLMLPVMLAVLAGGAFADEEARDDRENLEAYAGKVAERADAHLQRFEQAREVLRQELIAALSERDAARVEGLKKRMARVQEGASQADRVLRSVTRAQEILRDSDDVAKLREALGELTEAVQTLEAQKPPARFETQRGAVVLHNRAEAEAAMVRARAQAEAARRAAEQMRAKRAQLEQRVKQRQAAAKAAPRRRRAPAPKKPATAPTEKTKLHHMKQAAVHLRAAGMHEPAERILREVRELEMRLSHEAKAQQLHRLLTELKREVQALRGEVQQLKAALR